MEWKAHWIEAENGKSWRADGPKGMYLYAYIGARDDDSDPPGGVRRNYRVLVTVDAPTLKMNLQCEILNAILSDYADTLAEAQTKAEKVLTLTATFGHEQYRRGWNEGRADFAAMF